MQTKKQLLENTIRKMVKTELTKKRLNEAFDSDGYLLDEMQEKLYEDLDILIQKWAKRASMQLKSYVSKSNGAWDYRELADEFFSIFVDHDYWEDAISDYK